MEAIMKDFKPETTIPLHKSIRFHPDLTFGEMIFFSEIQSKNTCPFSAKNLGNYFGVSHQTILNWVKKLVNLGLLEVGIDYKNEECRQFLKATNKN